MDTTTDTRTMVMVKRDGRWQIADGGVGNARRNHEGQVRYFDDYRRRRQRRTVTIISAVLLVVALAGGWALRTVLTDVFGVGQGAAGGQDWNLTLVNRSNPIPKDYGTPTLTTLTNGQKVDSRIMEPLQSMFDTMRAEGLDPEVTAGYRTRDEQRKIMDEKVAAYRGQGMSKNAAKKEAARWVAEPGTSEHELGLAVDINAVDHTDAAANQKIYDWLAERAWDYGFILRYTDAKSKLTGTAGESWHYRYVGVDAAKAMQSSGECLEEYLD